MSSPTDTELMDKEVLFGKDIRLTISMTQPMKFALQAIAANRHVSISSVLRQLVAEKMDSLYPGYDKAYKHYVDTISEQRRIK